MAEATLGWARRTGIGTAAPTELELEFLSNTVGGEGQHVQSDGIRGIRGRMAGSVVEGTITVDGELVLEPRVDNLELLLQLALGGTPSGGVVLPAEALPEFFLDVDKGVGIYRYTGCKVASLTIRSSVNTPLQFAMTIAARTETSGITFPSIVGTLSTLQPLIHHQLVATIGGTARKVANVEVNINNALILDRFYNSQTRVSIPESDRIVTVAADFPSTSDEADIVALAVSGMVGKLKWTAGNTSLMLDFPAMQKPKATPAIQGRNVEIGQRHTFVCRRTTDPEVTATVDATA